VLLIPGHLDRCIYIELARTSFRWPGISHYWLWR